MQDNKNIGALFYNNSDADPSRPDFRGSIKIDGKVYSLTGKLLLAKKTGKQYIRLEVDSTPPVGQETGSGDPA